MIIFDSVLNEVCDGKRKLDFVEIRRDLTHTFENQIHTGILGNRGKPFKHRFNQFVDIYTADIQCCGFFIHFYKRKQIVDNCILTVDFFHDIVHEILIDFHRNVFLAV